MYNVYKRTDFNPRSPHGERPGASRVRARGSDFNPRSPHGERLTWLSHYMLRPQISIHAPRTGSDQAITSHVLPRRYFNPRSPHGERLAPDADGVGHSISIHAPRTGSDARPLQIATSQGISIHAPRTGSDDDLERIVSGIPISIHAPRTGSDAYKHSEDFDKADFNPRSPHGERHLLGNGVELENDISIHAPRTGSDFGQAWRIWT